MIIAISFIGFACNSNQRTKTEPIYEPTWESLSTYNEEPEWFKDAKFGIYFHWGPYSVPAFVSEWYPRWMYFPDRGDKWGGEVHGHHIETYGPLSEFNYHDFIPKFKGEHFDAKEWAALFKNSGAKFAGAVAQHHDGFAMWDSYINPWNSVDMGPKKDITGELLKELKKNNLKTITTFHHARNLQQYANDSANWAGNGPDVSDNSYFPYHPDYITSTTDPRLRKLYGNMPADKFHEYWLDQIKEVVDNYAPDIIWFDVCLGQIPENYRQKMVALQYNTGISRGQEPIVAYKHEDLPAEVGVLDIEQGGKIDISEDVWLTDITLSYFSWSYIKGQKYKDASLVIRNMIDVWSKNGVVLLNISPKANGVIPEEQRSILSTIGKWINKHQEAVYGTRTHTVYGYGVAKRKASHIGADAQAATMEYTKDDIRFTTSKDKKSLYIYSLGLPKAKTKMELSHVLDLSKNQSIKRVSVVGSRAKLEWSVKDDKLILTTPDTSKMDEIATVFLVEFE
jgi:alpha-L-fucosidase